MCNLRMQIMNSRNFHKILQIKYNGKEHDLQSRINERRERERGTCTNATEYKTIEDEMS